MDLDVDARVMLTIPDPPLTSLFLPLPNIHVTANTFVKFRNCNCLTDIGLIVQLNVAERSARIRLFLTWLQLVELVGPDKVVNVSFWHGGTRQTIQYSCVIQTL